MQPGPPYSPQPYHLHGYQQPGYPPPRRPAAKAGLIALFAALGVVLFGGMAVGVYFLIEETGDSSRAAAMTSSAPAGPPDSYTELPACPEISSRITNLPQLRDQPPGAPPTTDERKALARTSCEWHTGGVPVALVAMYLSTSVTPGSGAGAGYAKAGYSNAVTDGAQPIAGGLGKATEAAETDSTRDKATSTMNCKVHFYQGNIDAEITVFAADAAEGDLARCRENARRLAVATSEAIG